MSYDPMDRDDSGYFTNEQHRRLREAYERIKELEDINFGLKMKLAALEDRCCYLEGCKGHQQHG